MLNLLQQKCAYICLISLSAITCAPTADELCAVELEPNTIISRRQHAGEAHLKCEARLSARLSSNASHFTNPVFDLSFGGAPRTGVYIIRGNATCNERRTVCSSHFRVAADSIGNLIHYSDSIAFTCQVADYFKNVSINSGHARCESVGKLLFSKELEFGNSCIPEDIRNECGSHMECGTNDPDYESESEYRCICRERFTSIQISHHKIICAEQAEVNSRCNYTEQCKSNDGKSLCKENNKGVKVCQCVDGTYFSSEENSCRSKSRTTSTTDSSKEESLAKIVSSTTESMDTFSTIENSANSLNSNDTKSRSKGKHQTSSNAGIIFFLFAILLAIVIVVIIIRVRNKTDKRTITKKNKLNKSEPSDDKDGEQSKPILDNNIAVDEVDEDSRQTSNDGIADQNSQSDREENNNKININNSADHDSQRTQTNV